MTYRPSFFYAGLHEPGLGKFESASSAELGDLVSSMMGDGVDEETGEGDGGAWVGIMRDVSLWVEVTARGAAIVKEYDHKNLASLRARLVRAYPRTKAIVVTVDSQGSVDIGLYGSNEEAEKEYERIAALYDSGDEEDDDSDDDEA